jgi:hypothetical protein
MDNKESQRVTLWSHVCVKTDKEVNSFIVKLLRKVDVIIEIASLGAMMFGPFECLLLSLAK